VLKYLKAMIRLSLHTFTCELYKCELYITHSLVNLNFIFLRTEIFQKNLQKYWTKRLCSRFIKKWIKALGLSKHLKLKKNCVDEEIIQRFISDNNKSLVSYVVV